MTHLSLGASPNILLAGGLFAAVLLAGVIIDARLLRRVGPWSKRLARRARRVGERSWSAHEAMALVLLILLTQAFLMLALTAVNRLRWLPDEWVVAASLFVQTLAIPLVALGAVSVVIRRQGISWGPAFGLTLRDLPRGCLRGACGYLAFMPLVVAAALVYLAVLKQLHYPLESQSAVQILFGPGQPAWLRIYLALAAVTMAPFGEELFFRGILFPAAARITGAAPAAVIVALLFALIHFHVPSIIPLWVVAIGFSVVYAESGTLVAPVVMHALFNAVNLLILFLSKDALPLVRTVSQ